MDASDRAAVFTVLNTARSLMSSSLLHIDPQTSHCGKCRGKGFDPKHGGGVRKCQRCRGKGYTTVGRTKR